MSINLKYGMVADHRGLKCCYCGTVMQTGDKHPIEAEFVNGYPAPCRKIGAPTSAHLIQDGPTEYWLSAHFVKYFDLYPEASP